MKIFSFSKSCSKLCKVTLVNSRTLSVELWNKFPLFLIFDFVGFLKKKAATEIWTLPFVQPLMQRFLKDVAVSLCSWNVFGSNMSNSAANEVNRNSVKEMSALITVDYYSGIRKHTSLSLGIWNGLYLLLLSQCHTLMFGWKDFLLCLGFGDFFWLV